MTDTAFWVLLLSLLAVVVVLRLAAELLRDDNFQTREYPSSDAELRCFFCAGDPKLCRCRDEIFNAN